MCLEASIAHRNLTQCFDVGGHSLSRIRADKVGGENGVQYSCVGSGHEYEDSGEIKNRHAAMRGGGNFGNGFDVSHPGGGSQSDSSAEGRGHQEPSTFSGVS